eukprot:6098701-Amphidinium_carterae.1
MCSHLTFEGFVSLYAKTSTKRSLCAMGNIHCFLDAPLYMSVNGKPLQTRRKKRQTRSSEGWSQASANVASQ